MVGLWVKKVLRTQTFLTCSGANRHGALIFQVALHKVRVPVKDAGRLCT